MASVVLEALEIDAEFDADDEDFDEDDVEEAEAALGAKLKRLKHLLSFVDVRDLLPDHFTDRLFVLLKRRVEILPLFVSRRDPNEEIAQNAADSVFLIMMWTFAVCL